MTQHPWELTRQETLRLAATDDFWQNIARAAQLKLVKWLMFQCNEGIPITTTLLEVRAALEGKS